MRHSSLRAAFAGAGLLAASEAAHANSGIGFFFPASVTLVAAVVPVILVESLILWWRLKVRLARAGLLSLCANLLSTFAGGAIGFALDMGIAMGTGSSGLLGGIGLAISLALMFGITLWIENVTVRRMQRVDPRPNVGSAVLAANLVSYGLLVAVVLYQDRPPARTQMIEVMNALGVARTEAAENFQAQGRFAAATRTATGSKLVRAITTDASGKIVAQLVFPRDAELDGQTVVYEPELRDGQIVAWHCYVPQAPLKYFPAVCRQRSAGGTTKR